MNGLLSSVVNIFRDLTSSVKGYRTYILSIAIVVVVVSNYFMHYMTPQTEVLVVTALGGSSLFFLRDSIRDLLDKLVKIENVVSEVNKQLEHHKAEHTDTNHNSS